MGGTSTDVCLIENGKAELRRENTIGDLTSKSRPSKAPSCPEALQYVLLRSTSAL